MYINMNIQFYTLSQEELIAKIHTYWRQCKHEAQENRVITVKSINLISFKVNFDLPLKDIWNSAK